MNCVFPAPVAGGNTETQPALTDMVFGALAARDPGARRGGRAAAPRRNFLFGGIHPRTGELYAHYHFEGVGWGGRHGLDGNNMVVTINGNCRNTPVEVFETRYPRSGSSRTGSCPTRAARASSAAASAASGS